MSSSSTQSQEPARWPLKGSQLSASCRVDQEHTQQAVCVVFGKTCAGTPTQPCTQTQYNPQTQPNSLNPQQCKRLCRAAHSPANISNECPTGVVNTQKNPALEPRGDDTVCTGSACHMSATHSGACRGPVLHSSTRSSQHTVYIGASSCCATNNQQHSLYGAEPKMHWPLPTVANETGATRPC